MTTKPSDTLITMNNPDSVAAEAFRILRTNISLRDFDAKIKTINVISTQAHESKSTVILNLAYAFSQLDKRVLVIDLDLRAPTLHKKLKIKNNVGISDFISRRATFEEVLIKYTDRFDVILSGTKNPYASEFIQSNSFKKVLNKLRDTYDLVLIDCPPVGLVTDGVITSTLCDGTILCVGYNVNDKKDLEGCRDLLKQFDVNILGIVMTQMPGGKRYGKYGKYGRYGNYGSYGSYGAYGSEEKTKKKKKGKKSLNND